MPYANATKQREATKAWREANPEKVKAYRKTSLLKKVLKERRIPRASSVKHHELTEEEIMSIVAAVLHDKSCDQS